VIADPIATAISRLIDSLIHLWDRSEAFLWSLAFAGAAVFSLLWAGSYLGWGEAAKGFNSYGLFAAIWTVVFAIIAACRTWDGRAKKTVHLTSDDANSHWGQTVSPGGSTATVFDFRMRATNIASPRKQIIMSDARLLRPRVGRPQTRVATRDPINDQFRDGLSIPPNRFREIHFAFVVEKALGIPGKPIAAVVSVSDHRGRWHKFKFQKLRPIGGTGLVS
jgi:hypothetical protein